MIEIRIQAAGRRDVVLLAAAQALFQSVAIVIMTLGGLVGRVLTTDPSLATLPIACSVIGTAALTVPASLLMGRIGRRAGFVLGALIAVAGGLLAAQAIVAQSFLLFCLANLVMGGYQSFAQFYRFAAAEAAGPTFASRAIAYVLTGGIVAAVAGPLVARTTRDALPQFPFAGAYLAIAALGLVAALLLARLGRGEDRRAAAVTTARPLRRIAAQPLFIAALVGAAAGYGVMILVMTATPLGMVGHGHGIDDAAFVIQWHVLGMFAPSFFTGHLIARFGATRVMLAGAGLLGLHVAVAASGAALPHFILALVLLGLGWNFLYVGGTALLTLTYAVGERAKVQALNDFVILAIATAGSFAAGGLLHRFGWVGLNLAMLPVLALAALLLLWLGRDGRAQARP